MKFQKSLAIYDNVFRQKFICMYIFLKNLFIVLNRHWRTPVFTVRTVLHLDLLSFLEGISDSEKFLILVILFTFHNR